MDKFITLSHGSGGKASQQLIKDIFVDIFSNDQLTALEDQARFDLADLHRHGSQLAFTTDSFVIDPIFFKGGDIGKLAIAGTVNDLAVGGAKPLYLSCSLIIEEGFSITDLKTIIQSMKTAADKAGVKVVTGDTKVVARGAADKIYINTAGVGVIRDGLDIQASNAKPGDVVICSGSIGDHGASIISERSDLTLTTDLKSDCNTLNHLVDLLLDACPEVHCLRDATRGGVATVLNEFATSSKVNITLDESSLIIKPQVQGVCEILGLDPLYMANEAKFMAIVPAEKGDEVIAALKTDPLGEDAAIIGEVSEVSENSTPRLQMKTIFGAHRIIDMLVGDQYPRIC